MASIPIGDPEDPRKRYWTVRESFEYCQTLARSHYENFPVASLFISKEKRPFVWSVYAFARMADDFADEALYEGGRKELLLGWRDELVSMEKKNPTHPVFIALQETIRQCALPVDLLDNLLTAFLMDVEKKRYADFDEVLQYCQYSANPVGRLVLLISGVTEPRLMMAADAICTALQLTNFWQDISVDLAKNRIYIPQDDLARFKVTEEDLFAGRVSPEFIELVRFEGERTKDLFLAGKPLLNAVGKELKLELHLTWLGGTAILEKVIKDPACVFSNRPLLGYMDKVVILFRALMGRYL